MIRVSEFGVYSETVKENFEATKQDPLSGMYPEAFELSLEEDVSLEFLLGMIGFTCLKHKALLEVKARSSKPMPSAVLSIVTRQESLQAITIIRHKRIMFILPTPSH
jgi:hypothetical protein